MKVVMRFKAQLKGLSTRGKRLIYFQQLNKSWATQNDQKNELYDELKQSFQWK